MIGRGTQRIALQIAPQPLPIIQALLVHEGSHEARRMVLWKQLVQGRRKQPSLLATEGRSGIGVLSF